MSEEETISRLASQTKNLGYYAGLTFGVGYCLTLIGSITVFAEVMVRSNVLRYAARIPAWFIAALIFYFIGVICGIYFGLTVIKNSKTAKASKLNVDVISSSINAFSFMLLFAGVGFTIMAYGLKASLISPISGVVGAILLFYGFKTYKSEVSESKLIGAILMLVSIIMTYFVAYREPGTYMAFIEIIGPTSAGPLFSEPTLEVASLLMAVICGIILAFPIFEEGLKLNIESIILSVSVILFSCGVIYVNFSVVSAIDKLRYAIPWLGYFTFTLNSIWIVFLGCLLLGISGILILVAACLPLTISAKQLSARFEAARPKASEIAPPKPVADVKYCPKCGASMPLDATYCPKCGQKQP